MIGQIPPYDKTNTPVHDPDQMRLQRALVGVSDQGAFSALSLYGQMFIGLALYLYGAVSTPGYLSVALVLPFLLALCLAAGWLSRRCRPGEDPAAAAVGDGTARLLGLLPAAAFLMDAQLALFALCAITREVLPDFSSLWTALMIAWMTALALGGGSAKDALPRLARLMRWVLLAMLLFCAAAALPYGHVGHLFPLWGHGAGSILRGALWMNGCAAGACWPWLMPRDAAVSEQKEKRLLRPAFMALAAAAATALCSAYLLPVYALARPETPGWRMLLLTNVSPSVPGWSLLLTALLLLLLMALSAGVTRAGALIARAAGKESASPVLLFVLLTLLVPAGALDTNGIRRFLTAAAPWRAPVMAAYLLALCLGALKRGHPREKEKNG